MVPLAGGPKIAPVARPSMKADDADPNGRIGGRSSALMERCGWPAIPYDGQLLVTHQDALPIGGKVQASPGFADHVRFQYPHFCERCEAKLCIEACSGQAIAPGPGGVPVFDREKCVHCGACLWNCPAQLEDDPPRGNIVFGAGSGGLHSTENRLARPAQDRFLRSCERIAKRRRNRPMPLK